VRNVYLECGHAINLVRPLHFDVRCEDSNCKFSPFHPENCKPPTCLQTCWQYHRYPEQYSPNINGYCPTCCQAMRGRG
ncbi:hypothetical protein ARMGADRAFT_951439, partial [Armillaria gallica]